MSVPTHLGKYEIRRELGKGSMGVVYEAFDPYIERRVAIKIIRQDQFGPSQTRDLLARLRREAQAAGRLNHPGIVAIYDYGEDATLGGTGLAFIAMELIDGHELKDYFDGDHRFSPADIVRIMGEVLAALQHAHERGVTHRDVKPSNVILLRNGAVKVADFGVARLDSSEMTQAGTMIGTPMYMAPEQILGQPVDGRADLFACGVMLYQFLTGEKPFTGSITTVMQKVLHQDPVPATQLNTTLHPVWDAVLRKALAKRPEDRYQSAAEMAEAIRVAALAPAGGGDRAADDEVTILLPIPPSATPAAATPAAASVPPVSARPASGPPSPPTSLPPSAPAPAPVPAPPAVAAQRGGVKPATVAIAAAVIGGAGLAAYLGLSGRGDKPTVVATAPAPVDLASSPGLAPVPAPPPVSAPVVPAPTPPATQPTSPAPPAAVKAPPPGPAAASAPATKPAAARAEAAAPRPVGVSPPPPAATPVPAPPGNEWQPRVARLEALRAPPALALQLAVLLEPLSADERSLAAEFEAQFKLRPMASALLFGVGPDGYFRYTWQTRAMSAERAVELARKRCGEMPASGCSAVIVNGDTRREGLLSAARELGAQPPAAVRQRVLRAFERTLGEWRQADAASLQARAPSAAPAPPPPAPSPAPAPSRPLEASPAEAARAEWALAVARLHSDSTMSLASGLATLLHVTAADDLAQLDRLQSAVKRMRWNSALALGERNGYLVWGHVSGERRSDWAQERALGDCSRGSATPCTVVVADGSFRREGLMAVAGRLGSRHQQAVREVFLRQVQRSLQSGF
ncbi:serine/threonine-protein kinase [Aquabacterium sp.]|uniref:serine/threonine-protein kinase n=1 Tax=Aquabacterium sp. TaxID=1872578 RepID=UPI0037848629